MSREFRTVRGYQLQRQDNKLLTSSMEDYLEMIYRNSREEGYLRINQLADLLNVRASSATKMVQKLGELGLVKYRKYGIIILTETGNKWGEYLLNRHNVIETFLSTIGITGNLLEETELIEHYISDNTLLHMELLSSFFNAHPELLKKFRDYRDRHMDS